MKLLVVPMVLLISCSAAAEQKTWCSDAYHSGEFSLLGGSVYADGTCQSGTLPRSHNVKVKAGHPAWDHMSIWCKEGESISFHSNGNVASCTLSGNTLDLTQDGQNRLSCRGGWAVSFDSNGYLRSDC